jgi:site-specific recombinase XerD
MELRVHYSILQRYRSRGNRTWYGHEYDRGLRRSFSLHTKKRSDAQAWLDAKNAERFLPESLRDQKKDRPIDDAISMFLAEKEGSSGNPGTIAQYAYDLRNMARWMHGNGASSLREITPEMAVRYTARLSETMMPISIRNLLTVMRTFCRFASGTLGLRGYAPFDTAKAPRVVKRPHSFWTPDQIDALLDRAPGKDMRLLWAFMAFSGLRIHEARKVRQEDIAGNTLKVTGKGGRYAELPVSSRLREEIERHGGVGDLSGISAASSNHHIKTAAAEAGIGDGSVISNHRLRHSFISNLERSGVDIKDLQTLARHSNVQLTLNTYAHVNQDDLARAIEKSTQKAHTFKKKE